MRAYPESDYVTLISRNGLEEAALARWSRMTPTIRAVFSQEIVIRFVDADATPPAPAEAVVGPVGGPPEIVPADRPIYAAEACRLVGVAEDELDAAIEKGRFPQPNGHLFGRLYWYWETLRWWVDRDKLP